MSSEEQNEFLKVPGIKILSPDNQFRMANESPFKWFLLEIDEVRYSIKNLGK